MLVTSPPTKISTNVAVAVSTAKRCRHGEKLDGESDGHSPPRVAEQQN